VLLAWKGVRQVVNFPSAILFSDTIYKQLFNIIDTQYKNFNQNWPFQTKDTNLKKFSIISPLTSITVTISNDLWSGSDNFWTISLNVELQSCTPKCLEYGAIQIIRDTFWPILDPSSPMWQLVTLARTCDIFIFQETIFSMAFKQEWNFSLQNCTKKFIYRGQNVTWHFVLVLVLFGDTVAIPPPPPRVSRIRGFDFCVSFEGRNPSQIMRAASIFFVYFNVLKLFLCVYSNY